MHDDGRNPTRTRMNARLRNPWLADAQKLERALEHALSRPAEASNETTPEDVLRAREAEGRDPDAGWLRPGYPVGHIDARPIFDAYFPEDATTSFSPSEPWSTLYADAYADEQQNPLIEDDDA